MRKAGRSIVEGKEEEEVVKIEVPKEAVAEVKAEVKAEAPPVVGPPRCLFPPPAIRDTVFYGLGPEGPVADQAFLVHCGCVNCVQKLSTLKKMPPNLIESMRQRLLAVHYL